MVTIVGHDRILGLLEQTARDKRPAHAYLFTGIEGTGKKLIAKRFAGRLNCSEPTASLDCSCRSCRRIEAGTHPDVIFETPERGMIRIDRVRSIQGFFHYASVESPYRVCIIDDAHSMNRAGQNALLKTLEEPPRNRILILVTANPALLLPTVRSRCRRIRFGPIPRESLAAILRQHGIDETEAELLAGMSFGSVARALSVARSDYRKLRDDVVAFFSVREGPRILESLELAARLSAERSRTREALAIGSSWIRDLLLAKVGSDLSEVIHRDLLDRIPIAAQHLSRDQLLAIHDQVAEAAELVDLEINVNPNIVADVAFLRIGRILAGSQPDPKASVGSD